MAKPAAQTPPLDLPPPAGVASRASAVAQRVAGLRAELAAAHSVAQQAQLREALTRTELTLALEQALTGRAKAEANLRRESASAWLVRARPQGLTRRTAFAVQLQRLLLRLGPWGHGQIMARSGVWRGAAGTVDYARRRADPTAAPATLFDQAWYLARYPDAAASGLAPLVHYLARGAAAGHSPHPLFDPVHYGQENISDLRGYGVSPLEHFVREGAARGRDPHPLFDIAYYVAQSPDLAAGEDPVSHYVRAGWREGLTPHPLFDPAWYRRQMPRQADVAPLVHYVTEGWREGLSPHPLFDARWYLEQYADVAEAGFEPLAHFLTSGAAEGRSPSPWFDVPHYVAARGEAMDPAANPLLDYLQGGAWTVAEARPGFPTAAYLAATPELVGEGMTPLEHWVRKSAGA